MYSGDEKGRKQKYSKITAGSVQNDDFYCIKLLFALHHLTNPISLTILNNVSMKVVGIGCLLSLAI
jgi:hypothetical protein